MKAGWLQRPIAHPRVLDHPVFGHRRRQVPRVLLDPASHGRDADHPLDAQSADRPARRPGGVHIVTLDALRPGVRSHQPEHGMRARERLPDDIRVTVRTLDDLDPLAHGGESRAGSRTITRTGSSASRRPSTTWRPI